MESAMIAYSQFDWWIAVSVMCSYILVDGLYARYTLDVVARKPAIAATVGAGMHFLLAYWVINYTQNRLYIFPLVIGSWLGTYVVVTYEKQKNTTKS